jgi:hypothetical protein
MPNGWFFLGEVIKVNCRYRLPIYSCKEMRDAVVLSVVVFSENGDDISRDNDY